MAGFPGHLLLPGSKFRQEIINIFQEEVAAKEQKEQGYFFTENHFASPPVDMIFNGI